MKVKLPRQLKQFLQAQIDGGRFENFSDAFADCARLLEKVDGVRASLQKSNYAVLGDVNDEDIEAMAFLVLLEAAKSAQEDLRESMARVKAINDAKAAQRDLVTKVSHDISENAARRPPLKFSRGGIGSEEGYHKMPVPQVDPATSGGLRRVPRDLQPGPIKDVDELRSIGENLRSELDSLSDLGELEAMRLQLLMDRRSKAMTALSNLIKKIGETSSPIVHNLK